MASPLNRKLKLFIMLIIILAVSCQLLAVSSYSQAPRYVRVAIFQDFSSLRLKINGPYEIIEAESNKALKGGKNLNTTVTAYAGGILLGNVKSKANKLFIKPYYPESVIINGRTFRGNIQLIKNNMKLSVINHIELEDYVKGISVRETSHYWPVDSLKAEVIVFRTFALYKMQENNKKDFDLTSDVYSQVYSGRAAERYRINKTVDETRGLTLTYKGKILPAFYHATCGGNTDDAALFWNIDIPPLKGVVCNFCQGSPHFKWHNVLTRQEVKDALVKGGLSIEDIKDIVILGRDKSERITDLKIVTDKKDIKISAKDFRNMLGPNIIKSTNFQVKVVDDDAVFEGFGWGHGVGLCQWGAYFMAKQGYTYKQILEYYYPGSEISLITK
ncbi:MAG: SpoIID/LytB domain-containing protein [Candidatus Omnitrophota bacterium]|nr:SpoIID/LytB domain-containing protein [Candidatus Omnitrophota bacterium]